MAARYNRFSKDDERIHQALVDLVESKKKPTRAKPRFDGFTPGGVITEGEPIHPRRMSKFTLKELTGKKPMATHYFGKLDRYDCIGKENHRKIRELFAIQNDQKNPAHRISDERIAWVCGWIFGKNMEHLDNVDLQNKAFEYLRAVWRSPTFCTFFSPQESRANLFATGSSWMIRLSTTFPRCVRITTEETNEGFTPKTALAIHKKREIIHVHLQDTGILPMMFFLITNYLDPRLGFSPDA